MSSHNEQIKPTEFDPGDGPPSGPDSPELDNNEQRGQRWVWPLLLTLVVVIVLVVVWLPGRINQQAVVTPAANEVVPSSPPAQAGSRGAPVAGEVSPWSDAQTAKMRKQAQDILTDLLEVQSMLEEIGVEQWAEEAYANARATAVAGDAEYREGRFETAGESYQQGLEELQALFDQAPQVLAENLLRARQAIEAGDEENANAGLQIAAAIEPDNEELYRLQQRAAVMEPLFSLFAQAVEAESSADLGQAEALLKQAVALDSLSRRARAELERVTRAYIAQRFNTAMSSGYLALNQGRFGQARSAFRTAGRLVTGSAEAASALQDVDSAETAHHLSELQRSGEAYEAREQWAAAVLAFEQALQVDGNLLFAQEGLQRSRARARLDEQFRSAIEQPDRLSDKKVADATAQLLRHATTISPRGPLLEQQLEQLAAELEKANTPIVVTLHSDMETEVTLRKVARLGRFEEQQLSLRPGTYVAVGIRDGYRDVRLTFSIGHDKEPPTVVIVCTEQI